MQKTTMVHKTIQQANELVEEAEQMIDAMDRLLTKHGITKQECSNYLKSDHIPSAHKTQIEQELKELQNELNSGMQHTEKQGTTTSSETLKMGAGVLSV